MSTPGCLTSSLDHVLAASGLKGESEVEWSKTKKREFKYSFGETFIIYIDIITKKINNNYII